MLNILASGIRVACVQKKQNQAQPLCPHIAAALDSQLQESVMACTHGNQHWKTLQTKTNKLTQPVVAVSHFASIKIGAGKMTNFGGRLLALPYSLH